MVLNKESSKRFRSLKIRELWDGTEMQTGKFICKKRCILQLNQAGA